MYYFLALLFFTILFVIFVKLLSSVVKGCISALALALVVIFILILIRSTKGPVTLFNKIKIDNFKINKMEEL
ncbi:hypothetical protein A2W32_00980 [candidate division WWE3 bacterium RBG_16_37_10]|uniref:Uncharacterized protein n=1 Tax=candidate division WWE3 bacterium RBG_16_37_10 TaxID=1802610 RepID=A0A1F4UT27_UNCKA|nr:MAG: hypothetical protein A2W32_00980 [candidate division WWE3 bacterium RBG_16_37_10]